MKTKKLIPVLTLSLLLVTACQPVGFTQGIVQLPDTLQALITAGIVAAVAWGFKQLFAAIPWLAQFLGQYVDEVAVVISGAVIGLLNDALALVPAQWEAAAGLLLALIVEIILALGLFKTTGKVKNSAMTAIKRAR